MADAKLLAIGDLQGCYDEFQRLLEKARFDASLDHLWLTGDLVNRGPQSLATLRLCYQLRNVSTVVLGNHDLHLLAIAWGGHKAKKKDTLHEILEAPDADILLAWLSSCPLFHYDAGRDAALVHAGILPGWSIRDARRYSAEVSRVLQGERRKDYLAVMYGNQPERWDVELDGFDRLRVITNVMTRMRFISATGLLDMKNKGPANTGLEGFRPWFNFPRRDKTRFFFGHWAALDGESGHSQFQALDTGCIWGQSLRAVNVDTGARTEVPSSRT
ncbi:MAG: symmetrical bis(5'-nucleosyl)-tetraphosphatase [Hahellaceae bacterium]|nr:symmetrical bis(5'-nucleosyl)-tetraphosphatase [Hahellaceae bacterium]